MTRRQRRNAPPVNPGNMGYAFMTPQSYNLSAWGSHMDPGSLVFGGPGTSVSNPLETPGQVAADSALSWCKGNKARAKALLEKAIKKARARRDAGSPQEVVTYQQAIHLLKQTPVRANHCDGMGGPKHSCSGRSGCPSPAAHCAPPATNPLLYPSALAQHVAQALSASDAHTARGVISTVRRALKAVGAK